MVPIFLAVAERPLTTGQVAEAFGVHPTTVIAWADAGKLRCFRTPGGARRFRPQDVAELMQVDDDGPSAA